MENLSKTMNISIWFYLQKKRRGNKPETTENTSLCGGYGWVGWKRVYMGIRTL